MQMLHRAGAERAPLWPIALSRVLIGLLWLGSLRWKLPPNFAPETGRGLLDWLQLEVHAPLLTWFQRDARLAGPVGSA